MTNSKRVVRALAGLGGLLLAAMTPGLASAQGGVPPAVEITVIHVKPGQEQAFETWVKTDSNPVRIKGGAKTRDTWTTANLGVGGEVFFARPISGLASYDTPPIGVSQAEVDAVIAKRQALITDMRSYLITPQPQLGFAPKVGYQPKLAVLVTDSVTPGRVAAYRANLKAVSGVVAKTNAKGMLVSQAGLGGDPNEFNVLIFFDSFADADKFPGQFNKAAAAAKVAPQPPGLVAHSEWRVIRYRPELSIVAGK